MKYGWLIIALFIVACSKTEEGDIFGELLTLNDPVSVAEILENPEKYNNQEMLISGDIKKVCQKKGCWMTMLANEDEMIIRFKDYGFFVPKDASGRSVKIQGIFHTDVVKHEHGNECSDSCNHQNEQKYSFVASGVLIEKQNTL